MNKIVSLIIFFSSLFATRYDISFEKMREINLANKTFISKKVILSNATHKYLTQHFTIYWGDEYPATTLWADYDKDGIPDFITNTAEILEYVWDKEIDQLGFNPPEFTHINVYISDTGLYLDGKELTLEENICGYAVYTGDEEYIVINANPPDSYYTSAMDMLKITLAHEFFHLIQYKYSLNFNYINMWLYEGTAVLMEHLVYPEITDYINSYVYLIFDYPYMGLMNYNSLFPYVSVIFFDYLENKYGIDIIKKIWETFNTDNNALVAINTVLNDYNVSFNNELYNFYNNLENNLSAFSNSDILQQFTLKKKNVLCDKNLTLYLYPTGAIFVNSLCNNISFVDYDYNFTTLSSKNDVFAYNTDDFVVSFPKNLDIDELYYDNIYYVSKKENLELKKGWNLVTFKEDINLTDYTFDIVWVYRDNKWYGFSKNEEIKNYLVDNNMYIEKIYSNEGIWIYSSEVKDFSINVKKGEIFYNLNKGWNLISFPSYIDLNLSFFSKIYNINQLWVYKDDEWKFFSIDENLSNIAKEKGYDIINNININGFWVYKK